MHEGEIFDIRQLSHIRPDADFQIGKLSRERVAPRLGVANVLVEINDKQRHNRLLSYSIIVVAGIPSFSYIPAFPGTHAIVATLAWTFGASVVPWWPLVGLFWEASPVRVTVQDTPLLIYRREALP
jgi:hypothetical protein